MRAALLMSLDVAHTLVVSMPTCDFVDDGGVADEVSTARQGFVCLLVAPPGAAFVNWLDNA